MDLADELVGDGHEDHLGGFLLLFHSQPHGPALRVEAGGGDGAEIEGTPHVSVAKSADVPARMHTGPRLLERGRDS